MDLEDLYSSLATAMSDSGSSDYLRSDADNAQENLPTLTSYLDTLQANREPKEQEGSCAICQEDLQSDQASGDFISRTTCDHVYHQDCLHTVHDSPPNLHHPSSPRVYPGPGSAGQASWDRQYASLRHSDAATVSHKPGDIRTDESCPLAIPSEPSIRSDQPRLSKCSEPSICIWKSSPLSLHSEQPDVRSDQPYVHSGDTAQRSYGSSISLPCTYEPDARSYFTAIHPTSPHYSRSPYYAPTSPAAANPDPDVARMEARNREYERQAEELRRMQREAEFERPQLVPIADDARMPGAAEPAGASQANPIELDDAEPVQGNRRGFFIDSSSPNADRGRAASNSSRNGTGSASVQRPGSFAGPSGARSNLGTVSDAPSDEEEFHGWVNRRMTALGNRVSGSSSSQSDPLRRVRQGRAASRNRPLRLKIPSSRAASSDNCSSTPAYAPAIPGGCHSPIQGAHPSRNGRRARRNRPLRLDTPSSRFPSSSSGNRSSSPVYAPVSPSWSPAQEVRPPRNDAQIQLARSNVMRDYIYVGEFAHAVQIEGDGQSTTRYVIRQQGLEMQNVVHADAYTMVGDHAIFFRFRE
ncbi:hypothetical protein BU23DRAFT_641509 [Bimuria novae-zelandiae CBS 107.79]|uniref:RING-type domain-containing protein n=1 Tax=Bimuria novae-zelandiae CBS 107.79 TaxID=1447943 RepID=A0A6A5V8A2_9PLEO|nr:hypothetical protein BU23DRAFT_641509 [Bimuria novae-zelandiae CBS 107.79]